MNKVAVIILNYNTSFDCRKCVSFLKRQESVEQEIILVDNCSQIDDRNNVKLLCESQGCTFICAKENRGYNAGNNIGLRYAAKKGYKYALIANPDMEFPQTDYLSKMIMKMEEDEQIVVCGSDIVGPNDVHQSPMLRDGNWRDSFNWIGGLFKRKKSDVYDFIDNHRASHYCWKVSGCCLMVRLSFILEISYFDEYPFLYCEEAILSRQVEAADKRMFYTTKAQAIHRHIKSAKGSPIKLFKQWKRSRIYFIKRYSGDTWYGKELAIFSMNLYTVLMIGINRLKGIR